MKNSRVPPLYHTPQCSGFQTSKGPALRSTSCTKGGTNCNTRVPVTCQSRRPLGLHNTGHGKAKPLPPGTESGVDATLFSSASAGGMRQRTKEVVVLPSKIAPSCKRAAAARFPAPALSSSSPESPRQRPLSWEAEVQLGGTTGFCS